RGPLLVPVRRSSAVVAVLALLGASGAATAGDAPPWVAAGDSPVPKWVVSARIPKADQPILDSPRASGARRGSAALDVRLPVFAARRGEGCKGRWLEVGPTAWICEDAVELSGNAPIAAGARSIGGDDGLPFRYFFVGPDG